MTVKCKLSLFLKYFYVSSHFQVIICSSIYHPLLFISIFFINSILFVNCMHSASLFLILHYSSSYSLSSISFIFSFFLSFFDSFFDSFSGSLFSFFISLSPFPSLYLSLSVNLLHLIPLLITSSQEFTSTLLRNSSPHTTSVPSYGNVPPYL